MTSRKVRYQPRRLYNAYKYYRNEMRSAIVWVATKINHTSTDDAPALI